MAQLLRRYFVSWVIGGLLLAHMTTLAAAGGNSVKEHICHLTGSGQVIDRLVNERAIPRHLNHGDFLPDELDIDITFFYSFIHETPQSATISPGNFTIYNDIGGCGPNFRDIARWQANCSGQIRAHNHDCLSGDHPGVFGLWVSHGCSTAVDAGFTVECCFAD